MPVYTPSSEDVRLYECCILYPYPLPQKEETALLKEIESLFDDAGGRQIAKDPWGRRGLAYNIKGQNEGNFIVYHYEMDPAKVKEVDRGLSILKGVLRHIMVKPPDHYQIVKYAEAYLTWKEQEKTAEETKKQEHEDALKKRVIDKAKASIKREVPPLKKKTPSAPKGDMTEQIDKLISTDSID